MGKCNAPKSCKVMEPSTRIVAGSRAAMRTTNRSELGGVTYFKFQIHQIGAQHGTVVEARRQTRNESLCNPSCPETRIFLVSVCAPQWDYVEWGIPLICSAFDIILRTKILWKRLPMQDAFHSYSWNGCLVACHVIFTTSAEKLKAPDTWLSTVIGANHQSKVAGSCHGRNVSWKRDWQLISTIAGSYSKYNTTWGTRVIRERCDRIATLASARETYNGDIHFWAGNSGRCSCTSEDPPVKRRTTPWQRSLENQLLNIVLCSSFIWACCDHHGNMPPSHRGCTNRGSFPRRAPPVHFSCIASWKLVESKLAWDVWDTPPTIERCSSWRLRQYWLLPSRWIDAVDAVGPTHSCS